MSQPAPSPLARGLSDSVLLALGSLGGALLGLVSLRLLLTGLSEADYGAYCLFHVAAGILAMLLVWPVPAVLRLGAEEMLERATLGRTAGTILALIALGALGAGGLAWLLRARIEALVGAPVWGAVLAFAGLSALAQLGYALLQPAGRVGGRTLIPAAARACYALLLFLVLLSAPTLQLEQAIFLCTVGLIPGVILPVLVIGRDLGRPAWDGILARRAAGFAWPLLLRNLGFVGLLYVDVLVITELMGPVAAGRYEVAYRIAEQVVVFAFVLDFVAGPMLATAAARRDPATLRRLYDLAAPPLMWLWSLGAALGIALAEPLLALLGAKSAQLSASVLELLLVAVAIRGVSSVERPVLDAHLLSRWPTLFFFLALGVNLIADLLFIRAGWGIHGAALGTILGYIVHAVLRAGYIGHRFGVRAWRPYLGVLPVLLVLGVDRLVGDQWLLELAVWAGLAGAVVGGGRRLGLFPAAALPVLAEIRMPGPLRRALTWLYRDAA